ncbi:MAG: hypothetical protein FWC27_12685 [Firmicutes bacterium]|nr:hypothetical protein [Bacillota bacterium]
MKTKRTPKPLVCAALVMALCFGAALPALAADLSEGTEASPAQAAITKVLKMPVGTDTPAITFKFEFEALTADGKPYESSPANMPAIADKDIGFPSGSIAETNPPAGVKIVRKESADIAAGVTWPHAGTYVYKVTETQSVTPAVGTGETVTYSKAEYEISVYVENGTNGLYVAYIEAHRTKTDAGGAEQGQPKVDPTPGGDNKNYFCSQMIFTNEYAKTNGGTDPKDPADTVLSISKTVAGLGGNQTTKYFPFEVKVTKPAAGVAGTPAYTAYVAEGTNIVSPIGTEITAAANVKTDGSGKQYIEFTSGKPLNVNLRHGQRLVFMDLEVGASFTVTEAGDPDYKASYSAVLNGAAAQANSSDAGTALAYPKPGDTAYIGENTNSADYTNTRNMTIPTGISVDSLPYVVLIGVALAAIAGFAVFKARKHAKQRAMN